MTQPMSQPVKPNKGNFANDPARAAQAGRKGGQMSGGNFKNNPQRAAEAGRKGGERSHKRSQQAPEQTQ